MNKPRVARFLYVLICVLALTSMIPSALAEYATLRPGYESADVRAMQSGLISLGYAIAADGKYGPMTEQAVRSFQQTNRLEADGLAGRMTLTALYAQAPQFKPGTPATDQNPLPSVTATPVVPQAPSAPVTAGLSYVYTANRGALNMRNRPAYGNTTIAQLPFGTAVEVLNTSGSWSQVRAEGRTGYVQSSFLRQDPVTAPPTQTQAPVILPTETPTNSMSTATPAPTAPPAQATTPPLASSTAQVVTGNRGSLNLRERMSTSSKALLQIPYLAQVKVLARLGNWSQVTYGNITGYVMDSFLRHDANQSETSVIEPSSEPTATIKPTATPGNVGQINGIAFVNNQQGRFLNLRSSVAESNNIIGQIPSGTALLLVNRGTDWSEVVYEGQQGFVMTSFLRFTQEQSTPSASPEASPAVSPALGSDTPLETPIPGDETKPVEEEKETFTRILRPGDQGEDVLALQALLADLKYTISRTSSYDSMTQEAVKRFQSQNDLKVDGIFGAQTAMVLQSGAARTALDKPLSYKTLRIDNKNSDVEAMQKVLRDLGYPVTVNARFDIATHQAVVGFQQRNGLPITGIADALTQSAIYSTNAKSYATAVSGISASEGKGGGPSSSQVKLLHWFEDIKPRFGAGQTVTVYHSASDTSFKIRFYSMGNHADSEPSTWRDTQLLNRAFGIPSWNINTVYVKLPDGTWTLAAMHNRPHLTGAISGNGFGGHLCIHFLRDMDEVNRNDPDYGASNQRAIRKAWLNMTGEVVD